MGKHGKHGEESEEEKRARRLAKKEAKRAKEAEGLAGYSNEANPWNDPHLADAFVWGKKNEKARARMEGMDGFLRPTRTTCTTRKSSL